MPEWYIQSADPIAFHVLGLPIRWYALSYIVGILIGAKILDVLARRRPGFPEKFQGFDFVNYAVIGIIVGGRLGEVIFYRLDYFIAHPVEIFFVWQGGMASHGGFIGLAIAAALYCRSIGMSFRVLMDGVVLAATPGLFLGRLANFINSEMVGKASEVWWAVIFPAYDYAPRHPVQIYQALSEGPLIAFVLVAFQRFNPSPGQPAAIFLIAYGLLRTFTENYRELDPGYLGYLHGFTNGQVLSLAMALCGVGFFVAFRRR